MNILITGSSGFIGLNLVSYLTARHDDINLFLLTRSSSSSDMLYYVLNADVIVHLAGVNRSESEDAFTNDNSALTSQILNCISQRTSNQDRPLFIFSSSSQVKTNPDTLYSQSKLYAEDALICACQSDDIKLVIMRLPGIFGKWCRPNYNSVVATFCFNISRNIPLVLNNPQQILSLIYIDDLLSFLEDLIFGIEQAPDLFHLPSLIHKTSLQSLFDTITMIANRRSLMLPNFEDPLVASLYSTYISYLGPELSCIDLDNHTDERGSFSEITRSISGGQVSFLTAHPGVTRGGHYHNSKTERFLVVQGEAIFRMKCIITGRIITSKLSSKNPRIIESVPGWSHEITNIGVDELVAVLWSNQVFNPAAPDTYVYPL